MKRFIAISSFCLALIGVIRLTIGTLDTYEIEHTRVGLQAVETLRAQLKSISQRRAGSAEYRVAMVGDSMLADFGRRRQVPNWLQDSVGKLNATAHPVKVANGASPGRNPFDFYFLAELIADADPNLVVLSFNAAWLSRDWSTTRPLPELSAWLSPGRWPETLSLPIERIGLTLDRILLYAGIKRVFGYDGWLLASREQSRLGAAYWEATDLLQSATARDEPLGFKKTFNAAFARRRLMPGNAKRMSIAGALRSYGAVLDGVGPAHPVLRITAATVATFRRRYDIPVLVYLSPLNVEHLATLGIMNKSGLEQSVGSLEQIVVTNGGAFIDLHDLLPDAGFRDSFGHYAQGPDVDGGARIAEELAPLVSHLLRSG
jgi:hypothetical protein